VQGNFDGWLSFEQAAGAAGGAMAIMEVIPEKYRHMIGGPSLKVDLHTGAVVEGVLTFVITFIVLFIFLKGPRSDLLKIWFLATATVVLVMVGSAYTGPAMNPANVSDHFLHLSALFFHAFNCMCFLHLSFTLTIA